VIGPGGIELLSVDAPFARQFWEWLGLSYSSIDIDGSPGSIPLDLNYDCIPPHTINKFDLVTNFGTTEHIANQLNTFKVIHDLCAVGGIMIHHVPALGLINHGLLNYNPRFFTAIAQANRYGILSESFYSVGTRYPMPENIVEFISQYENDEPTSLQKFQVVDGGIIVALQKQSESEFVAPVNRPQPARAS
jgi:hypothetical protein